MITDAQLAHISHTLELAAKGIEQHLQSVLALAEQDPEVTRIAGERLFAYLHEQAAALEIMLLGIGVDEDVVNGYISSYRDLVPKRLQEMRESVARVMRLH